MDKDEVIELLETACQSALSMSMAVALEDDRGSYINVRDRTWMSPKGVAEALLELGQSLCEEELLGTDFEREDEDEEDPDFPQDEPEDALDASLPTVGSDY